MLKEADVVVLSLEQEGLADEILSVMKFMSAGAPKKLIVVSSIGTWSHTASSAASPLTCSQYPSRVPSPYHQEHKRLEDYALSLRSPGLQVNVLCPGVLYGMGEEDMYMTFRDAWQYQNTPVLIPSLTEGGGKNTVPTCHVKDLGNAVKAVAETDSSQLDSYILLVDEERCTLEEIVRSISENLNRTKSVRVMAETSYENVALDHPEFALLNIDLFVDSASSPLPMTGRSFVAAAPETCKEFVRCRNLKPLKIALVSPPGLEEDTLKRANELKSKYSLPLLTRRSCVDILLKSEEAGPAKAELEAIWNAEEDEKDITKVPDQLLAKAFRFCLASGTCMAHGYVMCDFPESENDAFVMFSDEPPPPEPSEEDVKEEEEPPKKEDKKKDKKKDKKGSQQEEEEIVIAPVVEFPLNPGRGPTHVLCFPASDEHLFSLNGALPVAEEEGAEPTVSEAGQAFKSRLAAYRTATSKFGLRPPKPEATPSEEEKEAPPSEEKKEGDMGAQDAGAEGEDVDTKAAEEKTATSLVEWLEVKFPECKSATLPSDEKCAKELSLAFLEGAQCDAYINEFIEEGAIPGIVFMNTKEGVEERTESAILDAVDNDGSETVVEEKEDGPTGSSTTTAADGPDPTKLPHAALYEEVTVDEAEEVQLFVDEYKKYCSDNVMKQVTLGMMNILKNKDDPDFDVVDYLGDFLIQEGKKLEREGEDVAKKEFDAVLKHVDEMSSRLIEGRDDSTIAGTVFSNFSSSRA